MFADKKTLEVMNQILRDYDHGNLNKMLKEYESGNLTFVVKCKDCKYFDPHDSGFKIEGSGACTRVDNHVLTMKTGFCWLGEKVNE